MSEHIVTIEFGYGPDYYMACNAPATAPCHADYDCSCESWGETGVEGGRPWHESYGGERHYGTYDPTTCGVRDWFENSEDLAELIKGSTQFAVQPEWEGEWYEYRIIETAPVDPTLPMRTVDEWVKLIDREKLAEMLKPYFNGGDVAYGEHVECADAVLAALPELIAAAPTLLAELANEMERLQAKVAAFADIEEAHSASYRMLRDQSGMTELVAEVNRLRALTTVDDAMVGRAAREIELHAPSCRPINWPDDHRELARVALEAALGVES